MMFVVCVDSVLLLAKNRTPKRRALHVPPEVGNAADLYY
jgi:hypothetical protein